MTMSQHNPLILLLPEMVLLVGACASLFIRRATLEKQHSTLYRFLLTVLLFSALLGIGSADQSATRWAFGQMFVDDPLSRYLKIGIALIVGLSFIYSRGYLEARQLMHGEYVSLLLFAVLGLFVLVSSTHLLAMYIGLELMSLSSYALVALRRDQVRSAEAGMKYFILGALASGILLYGISMLYGATAELRIDQIARRFADGSANETLARLSVVFLVAGLAFKLGVAPFHMWVPDVYQGAPTAVTVFIGSVPKLATFVILLRVLTQALPSLAEDWQSMLLMLGLFSIILGNISAVTQRNIKRMLAYSAVAQMGFVVLAVSMGTPDSYQSGLFYVLVYMGVTACAFGVILLGTPAGDEAESLEDWKGLSKRSPVLAASLALAMLSLAGIPTTAGFIAKFGVLQSVVSEGFIGTAVIAVLCSVAGAFYYLRIIKLMYFDLTPTITPLIVRRSHLYWLSANALMLVFFGLFPQPLLALCRDMVFNSLRYS